MRYPYRPKVWTTALGGLFFAGCAVILWNVAVENKRGLVINGIIHMEIGTATVFYWVLTGFAVLFVLAALAGLVRAFASHAEIVAGQYAVEAPRSGWSRETIMVPYATIERLRLMTVRSQQFLIVQHRQGKLTITSSMLPSRDDFETLARAVEVRWQAATRG